jgi:acetyltransferase-like isoleucine patch superfamily enzyme
MNLSKGCHIDMAQYFLAPNKLKIGHNSHINQGCIIDARGGITIGDNVSISHRVVLMTGSHDINTSEFDYKSSPIIIRNNSFVGVNATILQNVTIGEGAIVCAGAVVTKSVPEYTIVAGVPAKIIGYRRRDLKYIVKPNTWFC